VADLGFEVIFGKQVVDVVVDFDAGFD